MSAFNAFNTSTVTIESSGTTSSARDLNGLGNLVALVTPSSLTGAATAEPQASNETAMQERSCDDSRKISDGRPPNRETVRASTLHVNVDTLRMRLSSWTSSGLSIETQQDVIGG